MTEFDTSHMPEEDRPSEVLSEAQARRFCAVGLRSVALRLSADNNWQNVELDWNSCTDEYPDTGFSFLAQRTETEDTMFESYKIELAKRYPIDAEWNQEYAKNKLYAWQRQYEDYYEDELIGDELFHTGDDEYDIIGFFEMEKTLHFSFNLGQEGCSSSKSLNYLFYDEGENLIEGEVGYYAGVNVCQERPDELENLYTFGELMLDTATRENEQSTPTVYDLKQMAEYLKRTGLVSRQLKIA